MDAINFAARGKLHGVAMRAAFIEEFGVEPDPETIGDWDSAALELKPHGDKAAITEALEADPSSEAYSEYCEAFCDAFYDENSPKKIYVKASALRRDSFGELQLHGDSVDYDGRGEYPAIATIDDYLAYSTDASGWSYERETASTVPATRGGCLDSAQITWTTEDGSTQVEVVSVHPVVEVAE